jgi:hypothetical protein
MRVIGLPRGEKAPLGANRISITGTESGAFQVDAVVSVDKRRAVVFDAPDEGFTSESNALNAAIAWAAQSGCIFLYVERFIDAHELAE